MDKGPRLVCSIPRSLSVDITLAGSAEAIGERRIAYRYVYFLVLWMFECVGAIRAKQAGCDAVCI